MDTAEKPQAAQFEFKAEIRQLLDILVHSLYTNKEVFLRELVSNASDALDKLRFESSRGSEVADGDLPLEIRITIDAEKKILYIADTGIGMTREELIENIGTIAKSGSAEFLKKAREAGTAGGLETIIGKFGVGFYSVFMVAKEVRLRTKSFRTDSPAVEWVSDGLGTYTLNEPEENVRRGTSIEIHLREECGEFTGDYRLKSAIKKHSNFVSFPIYVAGERVNTVSAIWREPKAVIKPEQYAEFYEFLTYDDEKPFDTLHISVDAPVQFHALLFFPSKGVDIQEVMREEIGLDLYVRRVLIQHRSKKLVPEYLGFLRGVVDSEDLPLNISRETLQENALLQKIASTISRQVLSHLQKLATNDKEKYGEFWREHGRVFKLGHTDWANREKFAELLRFNSSHFDDASAITSFEEYISRAKTDQKAIYYISGPSRDAIKRNPHLEVFRSKGLEVLFLTDPFDEFVLNSLAKFKDFELQPVEHAKQEDLEKFTASPKADKPAPLSSDDESEFERMLGTVKNLLGDRVTSVRVSKRLEESPCCLVNPDGGVTSSMQRMMQIVNKDQSIPKQDLEVNPDHPLCRNLLAIHKKDPGDTFLKLLAEQLYESALLQEGYLQDPHAMIARIEELMKRSSEMYRNSLAQ